MKRGLGAAAGGACGAERQRHHAHHPPRTPRTDRHGHCQADWRTRSGSAYQIARNTSKRARRAQVHQAAPATVCAAHAPQRAGHHGRHCVARERHARDRHGRAAGAADAFAVPLRRALPFGRAAGHGGRLASRVRLHCHGRPLGAGGHGARHARARPAARARLHPLQARQRRPVRHALCASAARAAHDVPQAGGGNGAPPLSRPVFRIGEPLRSPIAYALCVC